MDPTQIQQLALINKNTLDELQKQLEKIEKEINKYSEILQEKYKEKVNTLIVALPASTHDKSDYEDNLTYLEQLKQISKNDYEKIDNIYDETIQKLLDKTPYFSDISFLYPLYSNEELIVSYMNRMNTFEDELRNSEISKEYILDFIEIEEKNILYTISSGNDIIDRIKQVITNFDIDESITTEMNAFTGEFVGGEDSAIYKILTNSRNRNIENKEFCTHLFAANIKYKQYKDLVSN